MEHTIDAKGKKLGRVATEVASFLMGKDTPDFSRNSARNVKVNVVNASGLDINPKKKEEKTYKSFSGYPGGLKTSTMEKVIEKKGYAEVLRKAVYGMLPGNKLRAQMMKNLKISE